jgi:hypothetical protein
MENVASSKAALEAKNSGLTGVFQKLVEEHRTLTGLLLQIRMSLDTSVRAQLFPALRWQLVAHESAEERVLYLAMSKKEQTRLISVKHRRTGAELQRLIERLSRLDYAGVDWEPTFNLLFDAFEHHTIEEESYYFPIAQRVLGEAKAKLMFAHYEAALQESHTYQSSEAH